MPKRVMAFVNGFNLYHSIGTDKYRRYRWLDLKALVSSLLRADEELYDLIYCTAIARWRSQDSQSRHRAYISALETTGVQVIRGQFFQKTRTCPLCKGIFNAHEEKLTDVNLAVGILSACIENKADSIYLVSGDNDLIPALKAVKSYYPTVQINVLLPIHAKANRLKDECQLNGFYFTHITEQHLANAQLPDQIPTPRITLYRPDHWK